MICEPAYSIMKLLGGPSPTARGLDLKPHSTLRWQQPVEKRGSGGSIPFKYHDKIIALAAERGIELPRGAFADPMIAQDILRRHLEAAA